MTAQRKRDSLVWGIILIAVGIVFLLERLGIDLWDKAWRFWPVILIVWGASKLIAGLKDRSGPPAAPPKTPDRPE